MSPRYTRRADVSLGTLDDDVFREGVFEGTLVEPNLWATRIVSVDR